MGKNTHKMTYLLYKTWSDIGNFLHVITVLDMSKISNIIDFDAYLVFVPQQIFKKTSFHGVSGCFQIWVTADVATSYAWRCDIYLGKSGDKPEVGQGQRVGLEMTEGLQGVTVTCDNIFTTYPLAQELLKRKIALVGTVRKNKPELQVKAELPSPPYLPLPGTPQLWATFQNGGATSSC